MKHVVGLADMKVSATEDDVLVTYALGSCLGITVYDPVARVGGLLHVMLPSADIDPDGAQQNPFKFVDTGVPRLFNECYRAGAVKQRMVVKVAGGARPNAAGAEDHFEIGKRNFIMLRKLFWKNGVLMDATEVGGSDSRTVELEIGSGTVTLKVGRAKRTL